ncbi:MAG TPA: hypothetical protein VK651_04135 [Blastocatellia bacterium]|jgi:hypothetical protein|nr:hypothetical protein [Blastocatellia bacterium]
MKSVKARAAQMLPWPVVTGDTADQQPLHKDSAAGVSNSGSQGCN